MRASEFDSLGSSNGSFFRKEILPRCGLGSLSLHGYFWEDLKELSSISAVKLIFDAEEETYIIVESQRSDLKSSINHPLVQTHWKLQVSMHMQAFKYPKLSLIGRTDVAAVLSAHLVVNLWNKTSEGTYLHLLWAKKTQQGISYALYAFVRPLSMFFGVCGLADQLQCPVLVLLSGGQVQWHQGVSGGGGAAHSLPSQSCSLGQWALFGHC